MSNDRYEKIRKALAMGPTPGPWKLRPAYSGTFVKSERGAGYLAEVRHCRTTQDVKADAHLIAACDSDTIRALLAERDALEVENERLAKALSAYQAAVNKIDDRIEYSLPMPPETKAALYAVLANLTATLAKELTND